MPYLDECDHAQCVQQSGSIPCFFPVRIIYRIVRAEPGPGRGTVRQQDQAGENLGGVDRRTICRLRRRAQGRQESFTSPGEHQISVRQSGYMDFTQKVVGEPGKNVVLHVTMQKDPRAQFPTVTSQLKLQVTPERAAVFLDDGFVGTVHEFSGVGRGMLVSPGKHRVKIALPGYQAFESEVNLLPPQKITIKTNLVPGSITQAGPSIKKD